VKLEIDLIEANLRTPFVWGSGSVSVRELLLVTLEGADGQVGLGEAAALEPYDGVSSADVRAALEDCRGLLAGSDGEPAGELLGACAAVAVLPQAVAALDLALWDLAGRRADVPVWRLLGTAPPSAIEVNGTISAPDRAGAARQAAAARAAGFTCVKVKVGLGDDAGRLAAVRAVAGVQMAIRLDANGAWSVPEAAATLRALQPVGIECCEEPVSGLAAIRELSALTTIPIAIDETAAHPGALDQRACELACLKIARCGGISGVIEAARRARTAGYEVYLASTLDGPIGIAAALHAAAAIGPDRRCGLATLGVFAGRVDVLPASQGRIPVPTGPGLGEALRSWYE